MKLLPLALMICCFGSAYAQDAPQPAPAPPAQKDAKLVATEALLNAEMAAHRDALTNVVELDRMVTELREQIKTLQTQNAMLSKVKDPPK